MHDHPSGRLPDCPTCREVTNHVTESFDRRLPFSAKLRLWMHLTRCPDCRAYAAQLRLLLHTLPLVPVPALPLRARLRLRKGFLNSRVRSARDAEP
jgi:hypothetical protein